MGQASTRAKLYWVASAAEGIQFLKREGRFAELGRPKLVVLDLNMPGMDGFDFLMEKRKNPALASIPAVVFSNSRSPKEVLRSYQLGASSYIVKPMSLESMVATVGTLVRYWLDIVEAPAPELMD